MPAQPAIRTESVGPLLRSWRERRGRSQLDVSIAADLSTRHLSYVETGRSTPGRGVLDKLADELEIPLRERNRLYLAAGYAPAYPERPFANLGAARKAVEAVLTGHEPNPALAVDVRWELLAANRPAQSMFTDIAPHLLEPPVNVLRATLHPDGLAPRIRNFTQWRDHILRRVRRQLSRTAIPELRELRDELAAYPVPAHEAAAEPAAADDLAMPLVVESAHGNLSLLYTTTVFGSPFDVTLDEIAIETFFPADSSTAALLRAMADLTVPS
ncbi:helix-turn-helix domain-containing protein [Rhodococcus sp. O3]|uniref:helix-turn-helix domain-containing protein n=1 Tax=Rhodococcus sp. O3 TaxID=3404919 RepID=UPI003B67EE31